MEPLREELLEKVQRGRVRPVKVLDDEEDGAPAGVRPQPLDERPKRLLPFPNRRQAEGRKALVRGTATGATRTRARGRSGPGRSPSGAAPGARTGRPAPLPARGPETARRTRSRDRDPCSGGAASSAIRRSAGRRRRTTSGTSADRSTSRARLLSNELLHRVHEPRLAQARLADEQHDLPGALLRPLPSVLEQRDLEVASGQRRQPGRAQRLDRIADLADALNAEDLDRLRQSPDPAARRRRRSRIDSGSTDASRRCRRSVRRRRLP